MLLARRAAAARARQPAAVRKWAPPSPCIPMTPLPKRRRCGVQLYAGAGLVTAARLKWDPSLYVAVRELFPLEYRVSAAALCAASAVLLALGHLCAAGLAARGARLRRALLTTVPISIDPSLVTRCRI